MKILRVFGAGMLISWLGALPLGTLNVTAFDIAANQGLISALGFSLAAVFVELIYVRLTLAGNRRLFLEGRFVLYALPLAIAILLYMSVASFYSASTVSELSTNSPALFPKIASPILLGLVLSALNPLQIPFWMLWNKYLLDRNMLRHTTYSYMGYLLGIGTGTLMGLLVFMFLGTLIVSNYDRYASVTNIILGLIYLGFSCYLLILLYKKHLNLKIQ